MDQFDGCNITLSQSTGVKYQFSILRFVHPLLPTIRHLIPTQRAGIELVTPPESLLSMDCDYSGGSHARLPFNNAIKEQRTRGVVGHPHPPLQAFQVLKSGLERVTHTFPLNTRNYTAKVVKSGKILHTVMIRNVLKINSDEDIVKSLRTQNKHTADGLDWDRERAKLCYRRRARNDLEYHPDQSPLVQHSRYLSFGHGKKCPTSVPIIGEAFQQMARNCLRRNALATERDDARGVDHCNFLDVEGLHILSKSDTPTFEVYRGDRVFRSVLDVTVYSSALPDRENEPIVLYSSCVWAPVIGKLSVPKILDAVQRSVSPKACRTQRTISLHSALIFSRLLPLDIRVREAIWLYEVKRSNDMEDTFIDRELKKPVHIANLPHPAHVLEIGYESVEDLDSQISDRLVVVRPQINTDGSSIDSKVGATLTEWSSLEVLTGPKTYHFLANEAMRDQRSLRKEGLYAYFDLECMPESQETRVQTSSPDGSPSQKDGSGLR
ncbi:hypothetical protein EVAR_4108_1 [Eumeta japonica]|uniref:Uncharacterized protein n=1 Tax=Eumeta variegata TaxID=151549 RepID=A0A4C1T707_EUMVA|nr:hypothetical protein EVAR_4108_1 [Eumeta japonica]